MLNKPLVGSPPCQFDGNQGRSNGRTVGKKLNKRVRLLFASPRKIESPFVHIYVAYRDYFQSADNLLICTAPFIGFNIYVLQITLASNELVSLTGGAHDLVCS